MTNTTYAIIKRSQFDMEGETLTSWNATLYNEYPENELWAYQNSFSTEHLIGEQKFHVYPNEPDFVFVECYEAATEEQLEDKLEVLLKKL